MAYATSQPATRERVLSRTEGVADASGKLLLRLLVGILVLLHGIAKLKSGPAQIIDTALAAGLPGAVGYLVYAGEVLAPLLLIVGLWTRLAALVVAIDMVFAMVLVHGAQLLALNRQGGYALELEACFLFGALAILLLGAGRFSLGGLNGRWN
ncbi:MAG: DoxX family protein [Burkholderiaceae bacterium]